MSDYNYIITVDENGSPSLQHALFGGGGSSKGSQRQNHKYYARAQDKGRWRYFYSPEEFRAWSSGATRKVKQTVDNAKKTAGNAAGEVRKSLNARRELNEANKATGFGSGLKQWNAQRKYNKTAMGKAEQELRKKASDLKTDVQSKAEDVEIAANKASKRAQKKFNDLKTDIQSKAEDVEIAANKASKQAKKKIKNLTDAAKEHGSKTLAELRNAARNAGDKVEDTARDTAERVRKAAEDKSGVTDQKNREEARRRAMMGLDDAAGDYADSDNRYQKSAKGKADKAVDSAKKVADRARSAADEASARVRDVAGRARDKASEAADRARDTAGNLRERASSAASSVADKASDIRDRIRELADSTGSAVRGAAGQARDAANNAASNARQKAEDVTGVSAKKEMDAQGRKAMMGLDDAIGSFMDAQVRYDNSAAGRTASAKSNSEASLKSAQAKAKKALAKVMDYLPDDQIEEIKDLIRGK